MKTNSIKDLDITEEMYKRALEVENAWNELNTKAKTTDCINIDLGNLTAKWMRLDVNFFDEVNSDFSTNAIIREYERRKNEITKETRKESNETVNRKIRYSQIVECLLQTGKATAKECAVMMMQKGYIPTSERNFTAPRLTELEHRGIVEAIGKTQCSYTHKKVTVYRINPKLKMTEVNRIL